MTGNAPVRDAQPLRRDEQEIELTRHVVDTDLARLGAAFRGASLRLSALQDISSAQALVLRVLAVKETGGTRKLILDGGKNIGEICRLSLKQVKAFLADDSSNAYEKLIDRLLASEQYGVRYGRHWLDVARYADSHGYQDDNYRTQWPWRDWVIHAFNQNMPYDQFVRWQLAGDELAPDDPQALAAAGVTDKTPDPAGGRIERVAGSKRPSGVLVDSAMPLVASCRAQLALTTGRQKRTICIPPWLRNQSAQSPSSRACCHSGMNAR